MDGNLEISIDKLPVKRLESIEENGAERFPTDVGYDEKRVSLIRRIDFAWALEREEDEKKKKQKKSKQSTSATQWPWQGMVENLQLAHQELSVIIDLIQTVEANDAVTVAGMTRPKLFPNEHLADLAVSTATKLQCYRVFDLVNREAVNQSVGVNITGIRENYLQLNIGPGASVFVSLTPCDQDESTVDGQTPKDLVCAALTLDSKMDQDVERNPSFPNSTSYEIFLQQIFHEHVLVKAKEKSVSTGTHVTSILAKEGSSLLSHFCLSLSHRITSNKVLIELEEVVCRVPYLHLISHPTWHSRASSWTVFIRVPQTVLHANSQLQASDIQSKKNSIKSEFRNKVIVNDNGIHVEAEGAPNVVGLFNGSSKDRCMSNKYDCDLVDLPVLILQQVASQVIRWLHGEALAVGMKASRDFLCLSFELDQGGIVSLVAHVDPEDTEGCISWWMVMEEGFSEERKLYADAGADVSSSEYKKFLGYLTLDVLYSTLMDMVSLCSGGGSHR
ncbi:Mediator of RNA polymerase II transcription subunit 17 [Linum perenne]